MFELVGPLNQVVVQYSLGLKFIGLRLGDRIEYNPSCWFFLMEIPRPKYWALASLEDALKVFDTTEGKDFEGFVAVDANFNRVKIKHPGYVNLHRIRDGLSRPGIMELIQKGDSDEVVAYFPQLKPIHDELKGWYLGVISKLEEAAKVVAPLIEKSRKDYALGVQSLNVPFRNSLYNLLRGQSIRASLAETSTAHLLEAYDAEKVRA